MQNLSLFESNSHQFTVNSNLSFNFNYHDNLSPTTFSSLTEVKPYAPIACCVLEHILTTNNLTNCEKLYYILADSLALISKNKGNDRETSLPSEDWAIYLGCSRSSVFTMQQSLQRKGYFIINKDWDEIGRNKRNLIIPTLPSSVFNHLNEKYPNRIGDHKPYNNLTECGRAYLDRSKLFIKLNYDLLKIITSNEYLNPGQKVIWLGFYTRCYKNYRLQAREGFHVSKYNYNNIDHDDTSSNNFSFICSYKEIASVYSCNTKHLSKSIRILEELGFIKAQNFYIRKKYHDNYDSSSCPDNYDVSKDYSNNYCDIQERQDRSLWKITLALPETSILELAKVKDRSNLKQKNNEGTVTDNILNTNIAEDYLMLGGIKFNLDSEQVLSLKSVVLAGGTNDTDNDCDANISSSLPSFLSTSRDASCNSSYIDYMMEELGDGHEEGSALLNTSPKSLSGFDLSTSSSKTYAHLEAISNKEEKSYGIKSDPHVAKSGLLLNKYFLSKIKDIKSNLGATPKVIFNEFLKRFKKDDLTPNIANKKKLVEFNIYSELIREKLKILPKDKADKARKFAYSLVSKKLASGYAASLSKHELAKQLIHHATSWKPTKLGVISREKEIDTALSVAWKAVTSGTWQVPLELAKAEVLQYEFRYYKQKYQESGILSQEISALESDVNKLLGSWRNLRMEITRECENIEVKNTDDFNDKKVSNTISDRSLPLPLFQLKTISEPCLSDTFAGINSDKTSLNEDYQFSRMMLGTVNNGIELERKIDDERGINHQINPFGKSGSNNDNQGTNYNYPSIEKPSNLSNINLAHISESQKYLKVIPSDKDDSVKLETINGKEYCVKLKELYMNEEGEWVMTLRNVAKNIFLELNYIKGAESLPESKGNIENKLIEKP